MRRGHPANTSAILCLESVDKFRNRHSAQTDFNQGSHDRAYHVVQEAVGLDTVRDQARPLRRYFDLPFGPEDLSPGHFALRRRTETGKIVAAK